MKNNRGYSLIEMIIVIAIIAVVGVAGLSFMTLQANTKVKECVSKISSSISKVKVDAMSKSKTENDYYIKIYKDSNNFHLTKYLNGTPVDEIIGNKNQTIKYYAEDNTEYDVSTEPLIIKFERETGGFKKMQDSGGTEFYVNKISVTNGSRTMELKIVPITGKVTIE